MSNSGLPEKHEKTEVDGIGMLPDALTEHAPDIVEIAAKDTRLAVDALPRMEAFHTQATDHLRASNWHAQRCTACGRSYFSKRSEAGSCGQCTPDTEFLGYTKRRRLMSHNEFSTRTDAFFGGKVDGRLAPRNVVPSEGRTQFTVAGVQAYSPYVLSGGEAPPGKNIVFQPCIRLQGMEDITNTVGCNTGFVNVVTLEKIEGMESHFATLDDWIEYFGGIGLNKKDLAVSLRYNSQNWGTGNFITSHVDMHYGGLHIFNASLLQDVPIVDGAATTVSDMGITVERSLWAVNKTPSFFDSIGPYELALQGRYVELDSLKTIVLMAASGVSATATDGRDRARGRKMRSFARKIAGAAKHLNVASAVEHFYEYWSRYADLTVPLATVTEMLLAEYVRSRNLDLLDNLGTANMQNYVHLPTHEFVTMLLNENVATIDELRAVSAGASISAPNVPPREEFQEEER